MGDAGTLRVHGRGSREKCVSIQARRDPRHLPKTGQVHLRDVRQAHLFGMSEGIRTSVHIAVTLDRTSQYLNFHRTSSTGKSMKRWALPLLAAIALCAGVSFAWAGTATEADHWPEEIIDSMDGQRLVVFLPNSDISASPQWPTAGHRR